MSSENIDNIKINAVRSQTKKYKLKSYVIFLIVFAIILLFLIFLGRIGNDVFGLLMFLIMFMIPVMIIFRNTIPNLMPDFISNSLYEIDNSQDVGQPVYNVNQKTKESAYLFVMVVLIIGAIVLIAEYRNKIEDKMSFYKVMGSLICIIFAGIMLANITGDELKISE
jgi:cytochrome bd-type quinol oxidase subunit 2